MMYFIINLFPSESRSAIIFSFKYALDLKSYMMFYVLATIREIVMIYLSEYPNI